MGWNPAGAVSLGEVVVGPTYIIKYTGSGFVVVDGSDSLIVQVEAVFKTCWDWVFTNGPARGGHLKLKEYAVSVAVTLELDTKPGWLIEGNGPAEMSSGAYHGATQFTSTTAKDTPCIRLKDCEGVTLKYLYMWTNSVENWGIEIDGTTVYPESIKIDTCHVRKFKRCIYGKNTWASNKGVWIIGCRLETTLDDVAGPVEPGDCIYSEDANHWQIEFTQVSGNSKKGNGMYFGEGDAARLVRVVLINIQWIGNRQYNIKIDMPSGSGRIGGFTIIGGNMENLDGAEGIASIWIVDCNLYGNITAIGLIQQALGGKPALKIDACNNLFIDMIGCKGVTDIDNTGGAVINVTPGYLNDLSQNKGRIITCANTSTETPAASPRFFVCEGWLKQTNDEERCKVPAAGMGIRKNLRVYAQADGADDTIITLRKNGANTTLTVTITAGGGTAWYEDNTHDVEIAEGDELNYSYTAVGGHAGLRLITMRVIE